MVQEPSLFDMHMHLGWMAEPAVFADGISELGVGVLAVTVDPVDYESLRDALGGERRGSVQAALGLHPWYVTPDGIEAFLGMCRCRTFIGEVGLDASERHAANFDEQLDAFERVCAALEGEPRVVSIHAVKSANRVMDVLEAHGLQETSACIMHWFSGTSDELARARKLGLWFSVSRRMMATKRGRAYVKQIPVERMLLETDEPEAPGSLMNARDVREGLLDATAELRNLLGKDVSSRLAENSRFLLGL